MLEPDVECIPAQPALKRRKNDKAWPLGPASSAEAFAWAPRSLQMLRDRGLAHLGENYAARLHRALQQGICLRTDYSGLGGAEEALHQLVAALNLPETCQQACDLSEACRDLLCSRYGPSMPRCVHVDILARAPGNLEKELETMRLSYLAVAEQRCKSEAKAEVFQELGVEFVNRAIKKFSAPQPAMHKRKAFCVKHASECCIFPAPASDFQGTLCSAAGVTCHDFSVMGVSKKFLGPSLVPFCVWLWERLMSKEDWFVVECVPPFDDSTMGYLLRGSYELFTLRCCPSLFGLPVSRDRKYMVCLGKGLHWDPAVTEMGHQAAFESLFGAQIRLRGDDMLRAPESAVQDFVQKMALAKGLPPRRSSNRSWGCFLAMSATLQQSLKQHERALTDAGFSLTSPVLTNLAQRPSYMGPVVSCHVPALLRLRRLVLPEEMLELQGHDIFGPGPMRSCAADHLCTEVSATNKKQMAGNAMHVQCIASVFMFVLACTRKLASASEGSQGAAA